MVPDRFQTPIRAPTASKMKTALAIDASEVCAACSTSSQE